MTGTFINVGAVLAGGTLGAVLGDRLAPRVRETVLQGLGLVTLVIGMTMALGTKAPLVLLGSVLVGGLLGEWWRLQDRLDQAGRWLDAKTANHPFLSRGDVTRGFVTATLVFCVGPMTIVGSLQEGISGDRTLLLTKSVLDGFSSLAFAAAMGMGVTLAAGSVLVIQGALTLAGMYFRQVLPAPMIVVLTAAGGAIVLGIGLLLLDIKRIRVANLLPSLAIAPLLLLLQGLWKG